jgi:NADPH:quinone reductase-like Zn-dependent oxidoreductase
VHAKRLTVFGVSNKLRTAVQRASGIPQFVAHMLPAFADGRIRPWVDQVFGFQEMPQAKSHMESNQHTGKIVIRIQ